MHCPTLSELPLPLAGKTGWPWTEESPKLPNIMAGGRQWPLISVVTPSYQQGQFIEETIRSVLLQGYPNLEYIIIDGGSSDNTVDIIRKYEPFISYWISEPDRGQSDAINKGWAVANGNLLHYLNSDDLLLPNAVAMVAQNFVEENADAVSGVCSVRDEQLSEELRVKVPRDFDIKHFLMGLESPGQPAVFLTKDIVSRVGEMDNDLHYTMDRDYWTRISLVCPDIRASKLEQRLAIFRWRDDCKSAQGATAISEREQIVRKVFLSAELPEEVMQLKRAALGTTLWFIAKAFQAERRRREAVKFCLEAVYWEPSRLKLVPKFLLDLY